MPLLVALPDGGRQLRRVPDEPCVRVVVGRSRLARGLAPAQLRLLTGGALGYDVLEDLGRLAGDALVQHLPAVRFLGDDGLAVGVLDLGVGRGGAVLAAGRQGRGRHRHRQGGHVVGPQDHRRGVRPLLRVAAPDAHVLGRLGDVAQIQPVGHADEGAVDGHLRGVEDRHGAAAHAFQVAEPVVVPGLRAAADLPGGTWEGPLVGVDDIAGGVPGFQPLDEGEHFEGRTRLEADAASHVLAGVQVDLRGRAVVGGLIAVVRVLRHGHDVAGAGLDARQRRLDTGAVVDGDVGDERVVGRLLLVEVEGGLDRQPAAIELVDPVVAGLAPAAVLEEIVDHVLAEVRRRPGLGASVEVLGDLEHLLDGHRHRGVELVLGDVPVAVHLAEDGVAAGLGGVGVLDRIPPRRGLRDPGQHRRFGDRQILGGLGEVVLRRGLDAVVRSAELGEVEVAREDLLFRHLLLDRHGEAGFVELAADRPLRGLGDELLVARGPPALDDRVLHVLLRDRGSARGGAAGQIVHEGPGQPLDVDAVVLVEPAVLDGHGGVLHMLRDLVRRNHDSVLRVETGDLGAVRGQEHRLLGGLGEPEVAGRLLEYRRHGVDAGSRRGGEGHGDSGQQNPAQAAHAEERTHEDGDLTQSRGLFGRGVLLPGRGFLRGSCVLSA